MLLTKEAVVLHTEWATQQPRKSAREVNADDVPVSSFDMSSSDWSDLAVLHEILHPFKDATKLLEVSTAPVIHKYGRIMLDILFRKLPPAPTSSRYLLRS